MLISPVTQSQFFVQASVWSHYFTKFSGVKDQASPTNYADGQTARIYQLKGPRQLQQFTLATPFDPINHSDIITYWKTHNCELMTITVTPVTCGEVPSSLGPVLIIPDAQIISLNFAQVDRSNSSVSELELGFIGNTFTYN